MVGRASVPATDARDSYPAPPTPFFNDQKPLTRSIGRRERGRSRIDGGHGGPPYYVFCDRSHALSMQSPACTSIEQFTFKFLAFSPLQNGNSLAILFFASRPDAGS